MPFPDDPSQIDPGASQQPQEIPDVSQLPANSGNAPRPQFKPNKPRPQGPQIGRPALIDLIAREIHPGMVSDTSSGELVMRPQSRGSIFADFLGNFMYNLSQGLASAGHGPGSFGRGFGGAVSAGANMQQQQYQNALQQQQSDAQVAQEQARTAQLNKQTDLIGKTSTLNIPGLGQMEVPINQLGKILPSAVNVQGKKDVEQMKEQSPLAQAQIARQQAVSDLAKARTDVLSNPNNPTFKQKEREINARLAMANAHLQVAQQGLSLRQGEFLDKTFQPAMDADLRLATMRENYQDALKGNQQAMLSLAYNHIGMTLGMQKGARINRASFDEAVKSQPWLQGIKAKFDDDGYLSGVALSKNQAKQMLDLGEQMRPRQWQKSRSMARAAGINSEPDPLPELDRVPEAPPIGANAPASARGGGKAPVGGKEIHYKIVGGRLVPQ